MKLLEIIQAGLHLLHLLPNPVSSRRRIYLDRKTHSVTQGSIIRGRQARGLLTLTVLHPIRILVSLRERPPPPYWPAKLDIAILLRKARVISPLLIPLI
jgi:hypothetical protein